MDALGKHNADPGGLGLPKIPGEKILFKLIELHEAEQLYKEHINNISEIIKNIKEIN